MYYELLPDEALAKQVADISGLPKEKALEAVTSEDPTLGRDWAVSLLESKARHSQLQKQVTQHRSKLRRA